METLKPEPQLGTTAVLSVDLHDTSCERLFVHVTLCKLRYRSLLRRSAIPIAVKTAELRRYKQEKGERHYIPMALSLQKPAKPSPPLCRSCSYAGITQPFTCFSYVCKNQAFAAVGTEKNSNPMGSSRWNGGVGPHLYVSSSGANPSRRMSSIRDTARSQHPPRPHA